VIKKERATHYAMAIFKAVCLLSGILPIHFNSTLIKKKEGGARSACHMWIN